MSLVDDLRRIGVKSGMTLMVHSSLSSIGWVVGGAPTVIRALLKVLGDDGTLVMPCATPQCADPATWRSPEIAEEYLEFVRDHLPVFDLDTTPTKMGALPETLRTWPRSRRSDHPLESVCAYGPAAEDVVASHPRAFSEGKEGPFGRLDDLGAYILLIGVGFNRCTALHYAESLVENRRLTTVRFPSIKDGRRTWIEVPNVADDLDTHFPIVGKQYKTRGAVRAHSIGRASSVLFPMGKLVDFARRYFRSNL